MKEGKIYKVTNLINGKIYIGATTSSINKRKNDHYQKARDGSEITFHAAIRNDSHTAFSWEIIDIADNIEELAEKEIYYIAYYNSITQGYNRDKGGGFKKNVHQYDLSGKFIFTHDSLSQAGNAVASHKKRISNACLNGTRHKNSYWSYQKLLIYKIKESKRKKVLQYNKHHKIIGIFNSAAEASLYTGISKTCITRCCRKEREQSGGYKWSYYADSKVYRRTFRHLKLLSILNKLYNK